MPGESDNIGTLSVDVTADTGKAMKGLSEIGAALATLAESETALNINIADIEKAIQLVDAANISLTKLQEKGEKANLNIEIKQNVTFSADTKAISQALAEITKQTYKINFEIGNLDDLKKQFNGFTIPVNAVIDSVDTGDESRSIHFRGAGTDTAGQSEARQQLASKLAADNNALGKMVDNLFTKLHTALKDTDKPLQDATDNVGQLVSITKRLGTDLIDTRVLGGVEHGGAKPTIAEQREAKKRGALGTESELATVLGPKLLSSIRHEAATIQRDLLGSGRSSGSATAINFADLIARVAEEPRRTTTVPPVRPATTPEKAPATGPVSIETLAARVAAIAATRAKGAERAEPIDTGMDAIRKVDFKRIIESTISNGMPRTHEAVQVLGVARGRTSGLQARTETDAEGSRVGDLLYAEMGASQRGRGIRTHGEAVHVKDVFGDEDVPVTSRARARTGGPGSEVQQAGERLSKARKALASYQAEDEDIKLELAEVMQRNPNPGETSSSFMQTEIKRARSRAAAARGAAARAETAVYDPETNKLLTEPKWKKFNATRIKSLQEQATAEEAYAADLESGKAAPKLNRPLLPGAHIAELEARREEVRAAAMGLTHSQQIDKLGDDWVEGPNGEKVHPVIGKVPGGPSKIRQLEMALDKARREAGKRASAEETTAGMANREAEEIQPYEESKRYGPLRGGGVDLVNLQHMANLGAFKNKMWVKTRRKMMTPTFDADGNKIGEEPVLDYVNSEGVPYMKGGKPNPQQRYTTDLELAEITPQIDARLPKTYGKSGTRTGERTIFGHVMQRADPTELFRMAAGRIAATQGVAPEIGTALVDEDLKRGARSTTRKSLAGRLHFTSGNVGDVGASVLPSEEDKRLDRENKDKASQFRAMMSQLKEDNPEQYEQILNTLRLSTYNAREVSRGESKASNKASRRAIASGRTRELNRNQLSLLFQQQGRDPLEVLQQALVQNIGVRTGQLPDPSLITESLEAIAYSKEPLRGRFTGYMPKATAENPHPTYVPTGFRAGALTQELGKRVGAILRQPEYGGDTTTDFSQLSPKELAKRLRSAPTPDIAVEGMTEPVPSGGLGYLADMIMDTIEVAYSQAGDSGDLRNDNKLVGHGARSNSIKVSDRRTGLGPVPVTGSEPMADRRIATTAQAEYDKKRRGILMQGEVNKRRAKIEREAEGRLLGASSDLKGMFSEPENGAAVMDQIEQWEKEAAASEISIDREVEAAKRDAGEGVKGKVSKAFVERARKAILAKKTLAQTRMAAVTAARTPHGTHPEGRKLPSWHAVVNEAAAPALAKLDEQLAREYEATEKSILKGRGSKPEGIFYSASKAQLDPNLGDPVSGRHALDADAARFLLDPDVETVLASFGQAMGPGAGLELSPGSEPVAARGRRSEVGLARETAGRRHHVAITGLHQRNLTEEELASITPARPEGFIGPIAPSREDIGKMMSQIQPPTGEQLLHAPGSESWTERQQQIARELLEEKNDRGEVVRLRGISQIGLPKTRNTPDINPGDASRRAAVRGHAGPIVGGAYEDQVDPTRAPAALQEELKTEKLGTKKKAAAGAALLSSEEGVPSSARSPMREQMGGGGGGGGGGFPSRIDVNVLNWPEALLTGAAIGAAAGGSGGGDEKPPAPPSGPAPAPGEPGFIGPVKTPRMNMGTKVPRIRLGRGTPGVAKMPTQIRMIPRTAHSEEERAVTAEELKEERLAKARAKTPIGKLLGTGERGAIEAADPFGKASKPIHKINITGQDHVPLVMAESLGIARQRESARLAEERRLERERKAEEARLRREASAAARPAATVRGEAFDDTDEDIFSQEQAKADEMMRTMRGQTRMANRKVPKRGFGASVTDLVTGILGGPGFERQLESIGLMERQQSEVNTGQMANARLRTKMRTTQGRLDVIGMTPREGESPEIAAQRSSLLQKMAKYQERHDKNNVAIARSTEAYEKNRKIATSFGTVLSSYRAAFIGSAASIGMGAISTGLGMAVVQPLVQAVGQGLTMTLGPALERALGNPSITAQQVGVADEAVTAAKGKRGLATAMYAEQAGNMTMEQAQIVAPRVIEQAEIEQGNKNLAMMGGALLADRRLREIGVQGITRGTSGTLGTVVGQTASTAEIVAGLLNQGVNPNMTAAERSSLVPAETFKSYAGQQVMSMLPPDLQTTARVNTDATAFMEAKDWTIETLDALNLGLERGGESVIKFTKNTDFANEQWKKAALKQAQILRIYGGEGGAALADQIESKQGLGSLVGKDNMPITDQDQLLTALTALPKGAIKPDLQQLMAMNKDQIRAQVQTEDLMGQMALGAGRFQGQGMLASQFGIEMAQQPVGSATSGIAKQDQRGLAGLADTKKLYADINQEAEQGVTTAKAFVTQWLDGNPVVQQFGDSLDNVVKLGSQISNIQIGRETVHAEYAAKQYNFQLFQMNRSYKDAINLRKAAFGGGGSGLGGIQGQEWALQRESTALGLGMSQRQINFQTAVAGITAPGLTGEERAARIEQAKIEAAYAQKQLDIQKKLYGLEGRAFRITADRSVYDLSRQIGLLTEGRAITIDDTLAQKRIRALNIQMGKEMKIVNSIFGQAQTRANDMLDLTGKFAAELGKDVSTLFDQLITYYEDFYNNLPVGGASSSAHNSSPVHGKKGATGFIGDVTGETDITIGEAGHEKIAVLRNPRNISPDSLGGGGGQVINIFVSGNKFSTEQEEAVMLKKIQTAIERSMGFKGSMYGLRKV